MKDILFKKVKCTAFLKKVWDGKFIQVYKGDLDEAFYCDSNSPDKKIASDCCGELDFLKTYYKETKRSFTGFVVGTKDIVTEGYLVADTNYDFRGCERLDIYKYPKDVVKCAIVYFGNNRKRFVPLESVEAGD